LEQNLEELKIKKKNKLITPETHNKKKEEILEKIQKLKN
jgi:hypothetical protein